MRSFGGAAVADLEADEAGNRHILAELGDFGLDELLDGQAVFLDERLIVKADLFVELGHTAFNDLFGDLFGLAFGDDTRLLDFFFLFQNFEIPFGNP